MIVKVVISCWPCFSKSASPGLRSSLESFGGKRCLEVLDQHDEQKITGYGFVYDGIQFNVFPSAHCYLSVSRNRATNGFNMCTLKKQEITDCDGVLYIDADHSFEPDQVVRLVKHDEGIVGAAYRYRNLVGKFVAGDYDGGILQTCLLDHVRGLQKVDWVGGGFVYIPAKVFGQLEYPWFRRGVIDCGISAEELGEDIGLCLQAKKFGVGVYCDCDIIVGHGT